MEENKNSHNFERSPSPARDVAHKGHYQVGSERHNRSPDMIVNARDIVVPGSQLTLANLGNILHALGLDNVLDEKQPLLRLPGHGIPLALMREEGLLRIASTWHLRAERSLEDKLKFLNTLNVLGEGVTFSYVATFLDTLAVEHDGPVPADLVASALTIPCESGLTPNQILNGLGHFLHNNYLAVVRADEEDMLHEDHEVEEQ
jgi:hypothetical protein